MEYWSVGFRNSTTPWRLAVGVAHVLQRFEPFERFGPYELSVYRLSSRSGYHCNVRSGSGLFGRALHMNARIKIESSDVAGCGDGGGEGEGAVGAVTGTDCCGNRVTATVLRSTGRVVATCAATGLAIATFVSATRMAWRFATRMVVVLGATAAVALTFIAGEVTTGRGCVAANASGDILASRS